MKKPSDLGRLLDWKKSKEDGNAGNAGNATHSTHTTYSTEEEAAFGAAEAKAKAKAWMMGRLRWKLDSNQKKVYDAIDRSQGGSFYFNKPRRVGGSYLLCLRGIEQCLRKPHAQVKYAAPTAKAVRKIIGPNIRKLLEDCPPDIRPKWNAMDSEYRFPHNGAVLSIAGCDNQNYENLRGTEADEIEVDECGFIDDLRYIITDVLSPQVQDTEGKIILSSTPARSPEHESVKIAREHIASGDYYHCTIYDNPRLVAEKRERFLRKLARTTPMEQFLQSVMFRREYLAEFIVDSERAVVPEWNDEMQRKSVGVQERPPHFDPYTSLDIGWRDGMALLFGYWDFRKARLVIEEEWLKTKVTTDTMAAACATLEHTLWKRSPYLRIADNDLLTIADLQQQHGLTFIPTAKDDKELQVNNLREWVSQGKLLIHPRCTKLIAQLSGTIWNKQRTSYERNDEGHGDLLDALVYLVRNIQRHKNPYPANFDGPGGDGRDWLIVSPPKAHSFERTILDIFGDKTGEA